MNHRSQHSDVVVLQQVGQPLELRRIPLPTLQPGEALVKITLSTICGSDLHTFSGRRSSPMPTILGHEAIGTIVEICPVAKGEVARSDVAKGDVAKGDVAKGEVNRGNRDAWNVQTGDRVTWSIAASCGHCNRCSGGLLQKCESLFKYGHEDSNVYPLSGGLSEYCLLQPGTTVVALPSGIPDVVAAPANCATATVAAAFRTAGSVSNRRVLITGAGMLGLTACAFASVGGASEVVVCDVDESRLKRAAAFGATRQIQDIGEERFDIAFEMSGSSNAVAQTIKSAAIGGTVVLVGSVSPSRPVAVDPEFIVRNLVSIHGAHNYLPGDLTQAVAFLEQHHNSFPFVDLVEATFPLEQAQAAFEYAESVRPIRVGIHPS